MRLNSSKGADRRVARTQQALVTALVGLLGERGWDEIGVQDICERADIGRSTFYMHYANKEELLVSSLANLGAMLHASALRQSAGRPGTLGFVRGLLEHVLEQRRIFRTVVGKRSGHIVQQRFHDMVLKLVRSDLTPALGSGWRSEMTLRFVCGALMEILAWSVDARSAPPVEELEREFLAVARRALPSA